MGFLNPDNIVNQILSKIGDIIIINLLFLLCSLPVITIGASATALSYSCLKIIKGDETIARKDFIKSFRENFKQSTLVWIVMLLTGLLLFFNVQFLRNQPSSFSQIFLYFSYGLTVFYLFELLYIFPVISAFQNTTKKLVKNAFLFTYMHLPTTLLIGLLWAFPLYLTFTDYRLFPLYLFCWVSFGCAALALASAYFFYRIFKKYLPEDEPEIEVRDNRKQ